MKKYKDVFKNICEEEDIVEEFIWPLSKDGHNVEKNKIRMCYISSQAKDQSTKGSINEVAYSILRKADKDQNIYGILQVQIDGYQYYYDWNKKVLVSRIWKVNQ